jgi:hypothetical protein
MPILVALIWMTSASAPMAASSSIDNFFLQLLNSFFSSAAE